MDITVVHERQKTRLILPNWSEYISVYIGLVWFLLPCQQLVCIDKMLKLFTLWHCRPRPDMRLLPRWVLTVMDCLLLLIKIVFTLYLYWLYFVTPRIEASKTAESTLVQLLTSLPRKTKLQTLLIQDFSRLFVSQKTKSSPFTPAATQQQDL